MAGPAVDVDALLRTLSSDEGATLLRRPSSTVAPPLTGAADGRKILETLRALSLPPPALTDEGQLGQGGMGTVRLATQATLGRKVAVKELRESNRSAADVEALLAEAWRVGALEHPNIVPVHDLGLDAQGLPVLVMKRIEGVTWSTLLRDPDAMAQYAPGRNALEQHLKILTQVCNALHFAHTRGVVHRDVKPDNVMVGAFGEVYLVDWGIASRPGAVSQLAGTPVYMAPEMLGGVGAALSAQTDVYLLGASLYEVLTGRPPHDASSPRALADSVARSQPQLTASVPPELAALVRACMAADPAQRPPSALAVRLALEDFVGHLGSLELTRESEARLEALRALLVKPGGGSREAFDVFSACRFGFQQALRAWPANERARAGLDAAVRLMVRYELSAGSARSAQALLAELQAPDEALRREVEQAVEAEREKGAQLERLKELERNLDPRTGGILRAVSIFAVGVAWIIGPLMAQHALRGFPQYEAIYSMPIALACAVVLWLMLLKWPAARVPMTAQLFRILIFGQLFQALGVVLLDHLRPDIGGNMVTILAVYWGLIAGVVTVALLPLGFISVLGYLAAAFISYRWPSLRYESVAFSNVTLCLNVVLLVWHQKKKAPLGAWS